MEEAAAGSEPLPSSPSSEARAELSSPEPDVLLGADGEETHEEMLERLHSVLLMRGFKPKSTEPHERLLPSLDLAGVAEYIRSGQARNIIVMCGAGISVSAGIPDFRSPGTGLYDNLQKYDLPTPQSIFELSYFRERPDAFYQLAKELWPDNFLPTPTHHFIKLLHTKGLLTRCFTQNIDSLEAAAGIPREMIVAAHGNFDGCRCIETKEPVPVAEMQRAVSVGKEGEGGWLDLARKYGGLCKPDIVFFGEELPRRFFTLAEQDFPVCDLLIVMGTSLKVQPFASLTGRVSAAVPRLLINRERVGGPEPMLDALGFETPGAFDFSEDSGYRDALQLGDCDTAVAELVAHLGWTAEFEESLARSAHLSHQPLTPPPLPPSPATTVTSEQFHPHASGMGLNQTTSAPTPPPPQPFSPSAYLPELHPTSPSPHSPGAPPPASPPPRPLSTGFQVFDEV